MPCSPTFVRDNCVPLPGFPLSRAMQSLLGALIQAIDTRTTTLTGAQEDAYKPETCETCGGSGYTLLPRSDYEEDEGGYVEVPPANSSPRCGTGRKTSPNPVERRQASRPESPDSGPGPTLLGISIPAASSACPNRGQALSSPPGIPVPSRLFGAAVAAALAPPATDASHTVVPPTTVAPSTTVPPPINIALAPDTSSETIYSTTASLPIYSTPPSYNARNRFRRSHSPPPSPPTPPSTTYLPGCSRVVPGYTGLGPSTPVPSPSFAVFCAPGAERYYTITKGVRVGVFSGWQTVSPYVQGISGASYSKHKNIHAAYEAYVEAYNLSFVTYV